MKLITQLILPIGILAISLSCTSQDDLSRSFKISDPNLIMELVATSPEIQTPIGMAIDSNDDLYVIESHTHTPAKDYEGPAFDRIKKGIDQDGDGIPEKWLIYADSLEDAMNLAFGPQMELYVSTKDAVWMLQDQDKDGVSDYRKLILEMTAPLSPYDHAAILGIAVSPDDQWLFVSRGNTGGAFWEIVGTDGASITGYGDGGNVIRCRLDGSKIEEVATGFWNPFDIKFTTDGRLMLTDNDPDSRGPNRLIEVVPGGDYGYKSLYGGSGLHPFVAWNGELAGTLPYAAPLGEAPCALLDGSFTRFGVDYTGSILVNIWEEKNIVKIPMSNRGSTIQGIPEVLIQGDSTFHPVAMVANSKGDVYVTNWVLRQYPNHGKGEIWKLSVKTSLSSVPKGNPKNYRFNEKVRSTDGIVDDLNSDDPFLQSIARLELARLGDYQTMMALLDSNDPNTMQQGLLVLQDHSQKIGITKLSSLLNHPDLQLRKAALFYIGTRQLEGALPILKSALKSGNITPELFDSYLATVQNLQPGFVQAYQKKEEKKSGLLKRELPENFINQIIRDKQIAESVRALALPYLKEPEDHVDLLIEQLQEAKSEQYQLSLTNTFNKITNTSDNKIVNDLLLNIGLNIENSNRSRAHAFAGLISPDTKQCGLMMRLLSSVEPELQYAIMSKLCSCNDKEVTDWMSDNSSSLSPEAKESWEKCLAGVVRKTSNQEFANAVDGGGSPLRGELVFKSSASLCQSCHKVEGWGGRFGPDLSRIGSSKNQFQLIDAILFPSKEMTPEWQGWYVVDQQGRRHVGRQIDVHLNNVELMNINGEFDSYQKPQSYGVSDKSVMPDGLQNTMTQYEFNDLIAYLISLK